MFCWPGPRRRTCNAHKTRSKIEHFTWKPRIMFWPFSPVMSHSLGTPDLLMPLIERWQLRVIFVVRVSVKGGGAGYKDRIWIGWVPAYSCPEAGHVLTPSRSITVAVLPVPHIHRNAGGEYYRTFLTVDYHTSVTQHQHNVTSYTFFLLQASTRDPNRLNQKNNEHTYWDYLQCFNLW